MVSKFASKCNLCRYTVVKLLAETFRIVVTEDVTRAKCWPDLLPALCSAMQESNLMVRFGGG